MNQQPKHEMEAARDDNEPFMASHPKHPEITVTLIGVNGNAFNILGIVQRTMRHAGLAEDEIDQFFAEATSGNYDHLLATCMNWVSVE